MQLSDAVDDRDGPFFAVEFAGLVVDAVRKCFADGAGVKHLGDADTCPDGNGAFVMLFVSSEMRAIFG